MTASVEQIVRELRAACTAKSNLVQATAMSAYMKHQFAFYGIKSPERKIIHKEVHEHKLLKKLEKEYVMLLWDEPQREMQYLAMDHIIKYVRQLQPEDMIWIEKCILTKSWWDTVDLLASYAVGFVFNKFPETRMEWLSKWENTESLWTIRTMLIFQLKYKSNTDFTFLKRTILAYCGHQNFFVKKGAGWALREYAKTNRDDVVEFVASHQELSGLTKKEALKNL
jgi:3-methyladenine DNA glycosylase AlkD